MHKAGGFGQRQRPAGIGCRNFSSTVANYIVGMDAPGLEHFHQGALDHEDHGLRQPNFVKLGLRR